MTENPPPPRERLYLLDTHGMIFQMFHGIPAMNAPDGRPTNAVFGVSRAIMNLFDHGVEYLIAVFDHKDPTFRNLMDENYKANRLPPPEDLLAQEPLIHAVLDAMRIPRVVAPGYEADDVLATIAAAAEARGMEVHLYTADKDCRQLLRPNVTIKNLRKNETLDIEALKNDWGIRPDQVVAYQALVGDTADNVPGVPGVGPKTATKWLQQYDTLEGIIAHGHELAGPKVKAAFLESVANGNLRRSEDLARLRDDVPIPFDWDGWRRREWDGESLLALYTEFGFRGFAGKVRATLSASGRAKNDAILNDIQAKQTTPTRAVKTSVSKKPAKSGISLFDQIEFGESVPETPTDIPPIDHAQWGEHYQQVDDPTKFAEFLIQLAQQTRFAIDLETTSLDAMQAKIVGLATSWQPTTGYYLPLRGPAGASVLDETLVFNSLKPILEDVSIRKVNQNIKYDLLTLYANGIVLRGIAGDSMIAHYLLHAGQRGHNLDDLTRTYLQHENVSITELIGKGKNQKLMSDVPIEQVTRYAVEDADAALRLTNLLEAELDSQNLRTLYDTLEIPLIDVLARMEHHGVLVDRDFLGQLSREMDVQLGVLETDIHALAGATFNIASPKQLREILFDKLKLPIQKRTGTTNEPSTDQESLERLAVLGHELPRRMIEHRQIAKLKGTYVDALPAIINPTTGRVHTSFNQTIAATGRLSSSDPNLQNIPARTDLGQQIRKAFIAAPGCVLLAIDYSQIELRFLAHFANDEQLQKAFAEDLDIHTLVAADIFSVAPADVNSQQRRVAKTVNFGVIYGMSAHGLAARLGIPRTEAETFITKYFERYPRVEAYQDSLLAKAREQGYVSTILGRRRSFDPTAIRPHTSYHQRNQAEREAINMEIQGSAADLMKLAMLRVDTRMNGLETKAKMILTVHDELVFELPETELRVFAPIVMAEMTCAMTLSVPLKVDAAFGRNWLDLEEFIP